MNEEKNIEEVLYLPIWEEFSETPGSCYSKEGKFSAEEFQSTVLFPFIERAKKEKKKILVDLDGTAGYSTGFLEKSFGETVQKYGPEIIEIFEFKSNQEDFLIEEIKGYMRKVKEKYKTP